jgi:hypothetical protein
VCDNAGVPRSFIVLCLALLAGGLALGLYFGWVVSPVEYVDASPDTLQRVYQDDYILMIATAYAGDGDLPAAQRELAALGASGNPAEAVAGARARLEAAGYPQTDLARLAALAEALGAATAAP